MKTLTLLLAFASFSSFSYAAVDQIIAVRGILKQFDQKYVWIDAESEDGKKVETKVPRAAVKNLEGYILGRASLTVEVSIDEIKKLNPSQFK